MSLTDCLNRDAELAQLMDIAAPARSRVFNVLQPLLLAAKSFIKAQAARPRTMTRRPSSRTSTEPIFVI